MPLLPKHENIIDAGYGSGVLARLFLALDHNIIAFDASYELAKLAAEFTQLAVSCITFFEFNTKHNNQNGIWACASLLNIPHNKLPKNFSHLAEKIIYGLMRYFKL